jgi:aspartate aminotransferase-like enzyme
MQPDHTDLLMTPGPTALPQTVREAMSRPLQNPDVEPEFTAFYRSLLEKVATVYGTDDDVVVLAGEGMLGLEASVASVLEPGEKVLCLDNGVFGAGFADLVETHGGEVITHSVSDRAGFDVDAVEALVADHEFAAATMVHCETPTGALWTACSRRACSPSSTPSPRSVVRRSQSTTSTCVWVRPRSVSARRRASARSR